jgi:hypothetical protein
MKALRASDHGRAILNWANVLGAELDDFLCGKSFAGAIRIDS